MSTALSPFLASYVETMNAQDAEAFVVHFSPDAVVQDEGHEHRGAAAIKAWISEAFRKYQPKMEVTGLTEKGAETVLSGLVSGTFDGSPVELHHHMTLVDGKVAALKITA